MTTSDARFNPPPGWPDAAGQPPPAWWTPPADLPSVPVGWVFYLDAAGQPTQPPAGAWQPATAPPGWPTAGAPPAWSSAGATPGWSAPPAPSVPSVPSAPPQRSSMAQRGPLLATIAVAALVLLAVGGYWLISVRSAQTPVAPPPTKAAPAPTTAARTNRAPESTTAAPSKPSVDQPDGSTQPVLSTEQATRVARASALVGPVTLAPATPPPMYEQVRDPACLAYDIVDEAYLRQAWAGQSGSAAAGDQQSVVIRLFDAHDSAIQARTAYEPCLDAAVKAGVTDARALDQGVLGQTNWWTSRTGTTATLSCIYGNVAFTRIVSGGTPPPTSLCQTFADEVDAASR